MNDTSVVATTDSNGRSHIGKNQYKQLLAEIEASYKLKTDSSAKSKTPVGSLRRDKEGTNAGLRSVRFAKTARVRLMQPSCLDQTATSRSNTRNIVDEALRDFNKLALNHNQKRVERSTTLINEHNTSQDMATKIQRCHSSSIRNRSPLSSDKRRGSRWDAEPRSKAKRSPSLRYNDSSTMAIKMPVRRDPSP